MARISTVCETKVEWERRFGPPALVTNHKVITPSWFSERAWYFPGRASPEEFVQGRVQMRIVGDETGIGERMKERRLVRIDERTKDMQGKERRKVGRRNSHSPNETQ